MCSVGMVRIAVSRSKLSGTKQPYEVEPGRVPASGPLCPALLLLRGSVGRGASETSPCRRAGNAKRRARPPWGDGEQPGRRRGNRDPRALLVWSGCVPRRLQLVFTRSSGRDSLATRCPIDVAAIEDGLLWVRCWISGHRPGGQSSRNGVRHLPQRDDEVKPHTMVSEVAVVVNAPVRRAAPQVGPKVRHVMVLFKSARTS